MRGVAATLFESKYQNLISSLLTAKAVSPLFSIVYFLFSVFSIKTVGSLQILQYQKPYSPNNQYHQNRFPYCFSCIH